MEETKSIKLGTEIKDYLDAAACEPIRINRNDGSSFILLPEDTFTGMQQELHSLQCRLISMTQVVDGRTKPLNESEDRLARFKK